MSDIGIDNLKNTCGADPTQYEGTLNGKWFYFCYRWGWLAMELWERAWFDGEPIDQVEIKIGDSFDGCMGHDTALAYMRGFVERQQERQAKTPASDTLPDWLVLALYEVWSEDTYCVSFHDPKPAVVSAFRRWLAGALRHRTQHEDYEHALLAEYRRQEAHPNA